MSDVLIFSRWFVLFCLSESFSSLFAFAAGSREIDFSGRVWINIKNMETQQRKSLLVIVPPWSSLLTLTLYHSSHCLLAP